MNTIITDTDTTQNHSSELTETPGGHNRMFEEMPPTRLFFRCAIPNMISMAVVSLYTIADGIFVGYYIGAQALAAINVALADHIIVADNDFVSMADSGLLV